MDFINGNFRRNKFIHFISIFTFSMSIITPRNRRNYIEILKQSNNRAEKFMKIEIVKLILLQFKIVNTLIQYLIGKYIWIRRLPSTFLAMNSPQSLLLGNATHRTVIKFGRASLLNRSPIQGTCSRNKNEPWGQNWHEPSNYSEGSFSSVREDARLSG